MADPQYYGINGINGGRWQTAQGVAGDPYYYGLNEAPNMLGNGNENHPWHMQRTNSGYHPGIVQKKRWTLGEYFIPPERLSEGHGVNEDGDPLIPSLGSQPNFMLGSEPIVSSQDYQGRKWANEFGLSGLGEAGSVKCILICAVVAGAVAAGVSYYLGKNKPF